MALKAVICIYASYEHVRKWEQFVDHVVETLQEGYNEVKIKDIV